MTIKRMWLLTFIGLFMLLVVTLEASAGCSGREPILRSGGGVSIKHKNLPSPEILGVIFKCIREGIFPILTQPTCCKLAPKYLCKPDLKPKIGLVKPGRKGMSRQVMAVIIEFIKRVVECVSYIVTADTDKYANAKCCTYIKFFLWC